MKRKRKRTVEGNAVVQSTVVALSSPMANASGAASTPSLLVSEAHSSKSAPAAAGWRPTGWSDLPADWLGYITAFLSLWDLPSSVLLVCRRWRDCLPAAPPREEEIFLDDEELAKLSHASVDIRQHVTRICMICDASPWSLALTHRLPRLTFLTCEVDCSVDDDDDDAEMEDIMQLLRQLQFPKQSITLFINLKLVVSVDDGRVIPRWSLLELLLEAVSQVPTLTELHILLRVGFGTSPGLIPLRTIRPLARLRDSLTALTITGSVFAAGDALPLSRPHVELLSSFRRLESIDLRNVATWSAHALEWVTELMATWLRSIEFGDISIDDSTAAVISRLTSLERFSPRRLCLRNPLFLANLTQLTRADLDCRPVVDPALLVVALSHCTRLEMLWIEHRGLTSEHLCSLLPSLPCLGHLDLRRAESLTSLAFASSVGHLARSLKVLRLQSCTALAPEEVRHLRALTALEFLRLDDSFNSPLDDATIASMTPESPQFRAMWPHLRAFSHPWSTDSDPPTES